MRIYKKSNPNSTLEFNLGFKSLMSGIQIFEDQNLKSGICVQICGVQLMVKE